jgi:hypothetical protein
MLKRHSRAVRSLTLTAWLICSATLAGGAGTVRLAEARDLKGSDSAIASQAAMLAETAQPHRLNASDATAMAAAAKYPEPLWLLVLGAILLTVGAGIKHIARIETKAPLAEGKTERAR